MIIEYHRNFIKAYHKLSKKEQEMVDEKIRLFAKNPFAPQLNNHILTGKYKGYCSINITGDKRAIYIKIEKNSTTFIALGTHSQLYG